MRHQPHPCRILPSLTSVVLACALAGPVSTFAAQESAEAFAARLQQHYDRIRDFQAAFVHTYEGGLLRRTTTERGTVVVRKPGRMRWVYTSPERKEFVADGTSIYFYVPADRQVVVSPMPAGDDAATPVLFLIGRGHLTRDFDVAFTTVEGAATDTIALRLTPKRPEPEYDWLSLVVDRKTLALRMLVAGDAQGGTSTFTFTDLKENVGVADTAFRFTIPRGTDVITER